MAVLLKNNTYKLYDRAVDSVLKPSTEVPRSVPHAVRQECLTFELAANQTETMTNLSVIGGGEVIDFNQTTTLRPRWQGSAAQGRDVPTIATADGGFINIFSNSLVEMSWAVAIKSVGTGGIDLWQTTLEMSDDNGDSYATAGHPTRSYNYHADLDVSVVSPPRKVQVLRGDIWRVRLWTIANTAGGGDTGVINNDGTFFTIRSL